MKHALTFLAALLLSPFFDIQKGTGVFSRKRPPVLSSPSGYVGHRLVRFLERLQSPQQESKSVRIAPAGFFSSSSIHCL